MELSPRKKVAHETQPGKLLLRKVAATQSTGGQPWKPHPPPSDEPKITKTFSKPQSSELSAAGKNVRTAVKKPSARATAPSAPIADGRSAYSQFRFFDREVEKVQRRFNQTFGRQMTINVQFRSQVMLAIVNLMLLHRKIISANTPGTVRSEITRFVRRSRNLNGIFDRFELFLLNEREHHYGNQIV